MHKEIIQRLLENKYEAFYVGGYVRDLILGIPSYDVDIVTSAKPDEIISLFSDKKVELVGKSFGVVIVDGTEVATYRNDKYGGLSDKNVEIKYASTIEEDLSRRDFTINSIIMDINGVKYTYGSGLADLDNRIIRFVGNPEDRVTEDPNRIIRACRFLALIDGTFDIDTFFALEQHSKYITYVAPERIHKELIKVLSSVKKSSKFFIACWQIGILKHILPSLHYCMAEFQGDYHLEPLFTHNMRVGDAISCKFPLLKLAGYLHDTGKVGARHFDSEKAQFHYEKHERMGALLAEHDLNMLRFPRRDVEFVCNVIREHMRAITGGPKSYRRMLRDFEEEGMEYTDFLRLRMADRAGITKESKFHSGDIFTPHMACSEMRKIVSGFKEVINKKEPFSAKDLAINGHDVMRILKIAPGKEVGTVLNHLLELVLDDSELNNEGDLTKEVELYGRTRTSGKE